MARLAYLGTPDMAVGPLRALTAAGHDIVLCVTRPDRRRGRGGAVTPSPVKIAATELGITVTHVVDDLTQAGVELAVVVAYGRILPKALLDQVPMANLHFSLLPRWRGAAPMERAILAGDHETGVCLMKVEEGLDTGPVYARRTVKMDDETYLPALREQLVSVAGALVVDALAQGVAGLPVPEQQRGETSIAQKITTEDLHLDWPDQARHLHRVIRLGRAWTTFRGKRLGVLEAAVDPDPDANGAHIPGTLTGTNVATGLGTIHLLKVQPESRGPMTADEWSRGIRPGVSERLGSD
jgi:methionyl-tRNA formyltransferase